MSTTRLRRWVEDRIDWTLMPDAIRREWVHDNPQTPMGVINWVETRIDWPLLPDAIWREWEAFKGHYTPDASEKVENMKQQIWKAKKFWQDSSLKCSIFNDGDWIEDPKVYWFDTEVSNHEFVDRNGDVARYEIYGQDWVEELPELTAPPSKDHLLFHEGGINPKFLSQVILIRVC